VALALLLVGSGLLFAIGSTVERHQRHVEHPAATSSEEGSQRGESSGESNSGESPAHVETRHPESGATLFGVNTESLALTVVAFVASLLLAIAVWLGRWQRLTLLAVAGFGLVFAAGDIRELVHQVNESNGALATIAAILVGLHLTVAALALALFPRRRRADRGVAAPEPYV
jgi:hypothetical protein